MPVTLLGGNPPGSSPTDIAGLQLWYDPSMNVYTDEAATIPATDGQTIRGFVDRASGYKVKTNGSASAAPLLSTTGVNGRPMLTWDATDDQLIALGGTADNYLGTSNTAFIVLKYSAANPATNNHHGSFWGNTVSQFICSTSDVNTPGMRSINWDGTSDTADKNLSLNTWMICTRMNNGSNVYSGVNDTRTASMTSAASGNLSIDANSDYYMRTWAIGPSTLYTAEHIHYNVALSEADRQAIETRLAWKFGITLPY